MKFTRKKFLSLSAARQIKKILDFTIKIEKNWQHKAIRLSLLNELQKCLSFISQRKETRNLRLKLNQCNAENLKLNEFLTLAVPFQQEQKLEYTDSDFIIYKQDNLTAKRITIPLYLILDNLRSSFNVGSIFRTAECFGIERIYLCGYTATPENSKLCKTAMDTEKIVDWKHYDTTKECIKDLKEEHIKIYALETTSNSQPISSYQFKQETALILGNEALGISKRVLQLTDAIIEIKLSGGKNSLNVSNAAAIACYQIAKQFSS